MLSEAGKDKTFDLILMDMQMPIMDGIEATKAICESGCQTPVVAMTANVMQEHRDMFSDVGAVNFLEKPINKQNLQSILQSYLKEVVVDSGVSVSSGSQISEVMNKCGRLLIIDDDKKVLQAYESVFDANTDELLELAIGNNEPQIMRQEFEFALANQGEDGVKLAKKAMQTAEPFQVAFIDMRMPPGIDGLQTKVPPNRWTEIGGS